jgi:hypothetical protein
VEKHSEIAGFSAIKNEEYGKEQGMIGHFFGHLDVANL